MFVQQAPGAAAKSKDPMKDLPKMNWEDESFIRSVNPSKFHQDSPNPYIKMKELKHEGEIDERPFHEQYEARSAGDVIAAQDLSDASSHGISTWPMNDDPERRLLNFPDSEEAKAAAAKAAADAKAASAFIAKQSNQEKLEALVRSGNFLGKQVKLPGSEGTYVISDSFSWLEPYYPRDHAWTWPQYQVSNESAYLNDVPAGQH